MRPKTSRGGLQSRYCTPYRSNRVDWLTGQGLVQPDADVGILSEYLHCERIEHLLTIIAMYVSKKSAEDVAPWLQSKNIGSIIEKLKKYGKR